MYARERSPLVFQIVHSDREFLEFSESALTKNILAIAHALIPNLPV
jgi:hypothetical protein